MGRAFKKRDDGTVVFATPAGKGDVPMISLSSFGSFVRHTFDSRTLIACADVQIGSDWVDQEHVRATFEKRAGKKAEVTCQPIASDERFGNFIRVESRVGTEVPAEDGPAT